jgi:antitoxin Phd
LIERTETEGPQVITRHGKDKAVILSMADYLKLESAKPDFKAYLLSGPKVDDLEIDRPRDVGREVDL